MYNHCKTILLLYVLTPMQWCKLPEEGDCAETCESKLTLKYTVYRTVHLLVQIKFVIHHSNVCSNSGTAYNESVVQNYK
jgi:hypothetical protein